MKKNLATLLMAGAVVLITAGFSFAEYTAAGADNFPYFHLGCLIIGGLIMMSVKHKYSRIYNSEAIGAFALYTVYVALFTSPVMEAIKNWIS